MRLAGGAVGVLTLLLAFARRGDAQDTSVVVRHLLPLDISRVQPFRRAYDMIVHTHDSTAMLGQREVVLSAAVYAGAPVWLLVETRTGVVPAVESLYVAPDMRPLHWSSALGSARLGIEFVGDTLYGATTAPTGRQNIALAGRPDLVVSATMAEALLALLPLTAAWADSVGVLTVDLLKSDVLPAELLVIGDEAFVVDTVTRRPAWVVALRARMGQVLFWIDKETGAALRVEQSLPAHLGRMLEYRVRPEPAITPPPV